jgi:hypothetical protein
MKSYLEHIAASKEGSWTLFDRRLPAIPFEWHYNSEYELTLTLNSRGQRFVGDNMAAYDDGDLVLIGPKYRTPGVRVKTAMRELRIRLSCFGSVRHSCKA